MANNFSELQKSKNGITPQVLLSDLAEVIKNNDLRAVSISYVTEDAQEHVGQWLKDKPDDNGKERFINAALLTTACHSSLMISQGFISSDYSTEE